MLMARKWNFSLKSEIFVFGNPNDIEKLPVDPFFIDFIKNYVLENILNNQSAFL